MRHPINLVNGRIAVYADSEQVLAPIDLYKETQKSGLVTASASTMAIQTPDMRKAGIDVPMDFTSWLPFAAPHYHISASLKDYVLTPVIIMPSDLPNRNAVGFPLSQLIEFNPALGKVAYKTWKGKPTHYEHCFVGDTMVRTSKGLKRIDTIKVGDLVLTHRRRYKPVVKVMDNGVKSTVRIDALGMSKPMFVTDNHPVWVVGRAQVIGDVSRHHDRYSSVPDRIKPHFRPVSDVYPLDYLVAPIDIGGTVSVDKNFAFLTGAYMAEGNLNPTNKSEKVTGTTLTIAYAEKQFRERIVGAAKSLGLETTVKFLKHRGTCVIKIHDEAFSQDMRDLCGVYSHKKKMKGNLRKWDEESLKHFLGGYISGDGSVKQCRLRCVTASEDLAHDLQMTFGRLGIPAAANANSGWGCMFQDRYLKKDGTVRRDGSGKPWRATKEAFCVSTSMAEVRNTDLLSYVVGKDGKNSRKKMKEIGPRILVVGNYLLLPISMIEPDATPEPVFNLEVEEDHTYIAGGVVVHNCNTDITKAYGVIVDTYLRKMEGYGQGKIWKLLALLAFDRSKHPDFCTRVLSGDMNSYSMGAYISSYTCSFCHSPVGQCSHLNPKASGEIYILNGKLVFKQVCGVEGFETSGVESPAYISAISDTLLIPRVQS